MKPVKSKLRLKTPSKPGSKHSTETQKAQDPVEVFCRLRSLTDAADKLCVSLSSTRQLTLIPPDLTKNRKAIQYTFNHVFTAHNTQKEVFDYVALPLVKGLLEGKNGLLFSYGVTGSGKTYTMTGELNDPGITPRCIEVLFNTIGSSQTPKFIIKSDKMNGFDVQTDVEASEDRYKELKYNRRQGKKSSSESGSLNFNNDGSKISLSEENFSYAIFVSYVEIYNNIIYDLLDENSGMRSLQAKIIREDCNHNMYINGVVEVEVKSVEEAFELYNLGRNRKKMAQTSLNTESSRSHSVFTIRLVIVPMDNNGIVRDRNLLTVAQLSLVDLAGSERCSRTQTVGNRLKEAGSINNSLMSLRTCLEILRENQQTGANRIVPYRESRLTHLFKNYFDGEGKVKMIVCVNPSVGDFDENVHVMKFAEMAQEVKVLRSEVKMPKVKEIEKIEENIISDKTPPKSVSCQTNDTFIICPIPKRQKAHIPTVRITNPESEDIKILITCLKNRQDKLKRIKEIRGLSDKFRRRLVKMDSEKDYLQKQLKYILPAEKDKVTDLRKKMTETEIMLQQANDRCKEKDGLISELQLAIQEQNHKLKTKSIEIVKQKKQMKQISEKMSQELDEKLKQQKQNMQDTVNQKLHKIELMKNILNTEEPVQIRSRDDVQSDIRSASEQNTPSLRSIETPTSVTARQLVQQFEHLPRRDTPIANRRYRRSRSVGREGWLEHRPLNPVPLGTVLQPVMKHRKIVNKLVDAKEVTNPKKSKYCLLTQRQDEVGDLETKLYKGDIIPTCSGGAQVIFDDVEKLRQESPTQGDTPRQGMRRTHTSISDKCSISIEGHSKKHKK